MTKTPIVEKLETFFSQFPKRKFKKKEIIIHAGEMPQGVYYLHEGLVRQYALSSKGEEAVLNMYRSPSFFPLRQLFDEVACPQYFEAMTEVHMWVAPRDAVKNFLHDNPDVLMDLLARMNRGLDGLLERLSYLMAGTAYERVITEVLLYLSRFGEKKEVTSKEASGIRISAKQIAIQSGLTRETVTRELAILKNKGLITFEKNMLTVPDLPKLKTELIEG